MRSLVLVFAAVLVGSLAACAVVAQDDSGSTADDFSHGHGPGSGRRPVGPIIAEDEPDAAPPATTLGVAAADADGGGPPGVPVGSDAEAPPADPIDLPPASDDDGGSPFPDDSSDAG